MKHLLIVGPFPSLFSYGGPTKSIQNPYKLKLMSENCKKIISKGGYTWYDYRKRYYQNILSIENL